MDNRISLTIPDEVSHILHMLKTYGHSAELVGGCVRDALLKRKPRDYDITTSALPDEVISIFSTSSLYGVYPTGIAHGTVTVSRQGVPVEITTYRRDGSYSDGRRPDTVEFSKDLKEDVMRRDFTINGLAYDGHNILDFVDGEDDLENKVIRAIGSPAYRFQEDALRMLRAIRLACQLGFEIDHYTFAGIAANCHMIVNVSKERIAAELSKILTSTSPRKGIELMYHSGLLHCILPEIAVMKGFDQKNPRHNSDVFDHTLRVLEAVPAELPVRMAALFHDVGKPATFSIDDDGVGHFYGHHKAGADITREVLKRLKFSNAVVDEVSLLVYEHMCRNPYFRQTGLKRMVRRIGADNMPALFQLIIADVVSHAPPFLEDLTEVIKLAEEIQKVIDAKEPTKVTDLAINGEDLKKIGFKPGPVFSQVLNRCLEMVIDDPDCNSRSHLYGWALHWFRFGVPPVTDKELHEEPV